MIDKLLYKVESSKSITSYIKVLNKTKTKKPGIPKKLTLHIVVKLIGIIIFTFTANKL